MTKNSERHKCEGDLPLEGYGAALDKCYEDEDGKFWIDNDEYASQVNYCPYCGKKAPVQVSSIEDSPESPTK